MRQADWQTWLSPKTVECLSEPFPEAEIGWKAQAFNQDKTRALAVPHITARHVMNRLDAVVGPGNWTTDFEMIMGIKAAKVMLTVFGITKNDIGFVAGDDDAAIKGSVSDGLKRAAVLFGIGRYLYETERQWVPWDNQRRQFAERPRLILKNDTKPSPPKKAKKARKAAPPAEPAERHWIADAPQRNHFWAYAQQDLGLSADDVHEALGIESVKDYTGTMEDAKKALEAYIEEKLA